MCVYFPAPMNQFGKTCWLDALRQYTGADLAAINAGTLTAELEEGEITESDLATSMLYGLNNHVVTECAASGANLISILPPIT